jgi:hypothetical protein
MPILTDIINGGLGSLASAAGDIIDKFNLSPEDKLKFQLEFEREANAAAAAQAAQVQAIYDAEVKDRESARAREMASPNGPGTWTQIAIAGLCVLGFFALLAALAFIEVPTRNERILDLLIGTLAGVFTSIVGYYFGSSVGAKRNGDALRGIAQHNQSEPIRYPLSAGKAGPQ